MKYAEFKQLRNLRQRLLSQLDIFCFEELVIKINHFPDYDLSSYQGSNASDYIFENHWEIPARMKSVLGFEFFDSRIYHFDDLRAISRESGIPHYIDNEELLLTKVMLSDPDILLGYGADNTEMDEFQFNHVRLTAIDNEQREITYKGTFFGDCACIDPMDWAVYANVAIEYIPLIPSSEFYAELIGESYILLVAEKFNLSYFLLFSAFESFINTSLNEEEKTDEEKSERLLSKIKLLFSKRFGKVSDHQVYISLMPYFEKFKDYRNTIAHGKGRLNLNAAELEKALYFTLVLILSYTSGAATFDELKTVLITKKDASE